MDTKLYIDGQWVNSSSGKTVDKYSPVTGQVIGRMEAATRDDVDRAIDAAEDAFWAWNDLGSVERSKIIYRAKELIEKNRAELENIIMEENGKPVKEAKEEVDGVIDQIQYYAEWARKLNGEVVEGTSSHRKIFQYKVPYGIVVALTPWNFPAGMVARKLAPALLTGNTVVLKPSSDTPGSAEWIVRKFVEAGVPKGVLNFITGRGSEIGDYIVEHKKVNLITMTGSTATGQRIMQKASANMAKLILELGGKAPFMVWKDADMDNALKTLLWAKYWNAGQSCIAAERLYVHEDIYDTFMSRFVELSRKLALGDPKNADMGPLINKGALQATSEIVEEAKESGAKILFGGSQPSLSGPYRNGYFFLPTIIGNADQKSKIFQEEIFAPVIGARKISSVEEMCDLANDNKYGLASYLFTKDPNIIFEASERIRFGELYVNMPGPEASQGYHTGFRMTGQAGEGSKYGISEYLKLKNIYVDYSGKPLHINTVRDDLFQSGRPVLGSSHHHHHH
uniref:D-glyceraldehyde dehydrogenase (NADP(+)) n=1 Tax=Thermoplasma acidophilum (strain ATCC 25905 / DSM 1728 / JCM 9062 / NBRC 15155 / AMRC-C165) TaxID=273075 RepID=UPI00085E1C85|nr:Chain A, D-glyceraldehyde dehydrogenase (NADP(+)) [Thermoplasma acidophilum DSM 1728]5M4X_B Chain B, D-glyceraldehyde dehydrogenase (NADP(+)) [Thermoplasma acidophilum DSM 1728]5M4X_C Chain C, D-glyceraldehyde dehydrogenase (NADP(+)) [Thermoplasma acidophilum DSM 1728]5M4X_D Chain D, D-glyceraldehyde dehydrogenase (NADP(+)) [Thermoplasma acidophilum DSM 1728]